VHDAVELGLAGGNVGGQIAPDAGHVQRQVNCLTVELPGQAADAGGIGHIHHQHLGAFALQAGFVGGIAHGGNHPVACAT
jgi:hypothetical protein